MSYKLPLAFFAPFSVRASDDVQVAALRGETLEDASLVQVWRPSDDMQAFSPASAAAPIPVPPSPSHAESQRFLHMLNTHATRERSLLLTFSGPPGGGLAPGAYLFTGFPWMGGKDAKPPMALRGDVHEDGTCSIKLLTTTLSTSVLVACLPRPDPPASAVALDG